MFHTTKYRSEELFGMNTKVSTVKGTTGGKVQTVKALEDARLDKTDGEKNQEEVQVPKEDGKAKNPGW